MPDVTQLLDAAAAGDQKAAADLLPLVYDELRKWLLPAWRRRRPDILYSPAPWSTRHICDWSAAASLRTGMAGATFRPRPPKPCGVSWSRQPGAATTTWKAWA